MTRLVDADALKETIMSKANGMEDLWDTAGVLNAINKAPTVTSNTNCDECVYKQYFMEKLDNGEPI